METGWKIIKYNEWCHKCKYQNTSATEEPCNECLTECARYQNSKPLKFKEKGMIFYAYHK